MPQQHKAQTHSGRKSNLGMNRRWKRLHTEIRLRGKRPPNRALRRAPLRAAHAAAKLAALVQAQSPDAIVNGTPAP